LECEAIEISKEKLRQVMMAKGLWQRERRRRKVHPWRERKHYFGEMVQVDGSHHDWLEGRGRQPDLEELLRGEPAQTQYERACRELSIKIIHANSPQAKGRIDKVFTLP